MNPLWSFRVTDLLGYQSVLGQSLRRRLVSPAHSGHLDFWEVLVDVGGHVTLKGAGDAGASEIRGHPATLKHGGLTAIHQQSRLQRHLQDKRQTSSALEFCCQKWEVHLKLPNIWVTSGSFNTRHRLCQAQLISSGPHLANTSRPM